MRTARGMSDKSPDLTLVCFAVKEEARFFHAPDKHGFARVITGMGRTNAANCIRKALEELKPARVITAGFAGGLNPELTVGTVLFEEDFEFGLGPNLLKWGAYPGKFHCAKRVAVTIEEKRALWRSTGADAVEMESSVIRTICREHRIPGATIRVISDEAGEDLPLDFNALMTPTDRINYPKLAWKLVSRPRAIPQLMRFQEKTIIAARRLGEALLGSLRAG
jgi:adenosylhomocysteine nucleosidase